MIKDHGIGKRICYECGKEIYFLNFDKYAWKFQLGGYVKYFCSYTCWKAGAERAHKEKLANLKKSRKKAKQRRAMNEN